MTDLGVMTNIALQGVSVSATKPTVGLGFAYGPSSWAPTRGYFNILNFGADPTGVADSTVAIYNALPCTAIVLTQTAFTTASQVTSATSFALAVTSATNAVPASGTGLTLFAQTTLGPVLMTYTTSSGTAISGCQVTYGISGGSILSGAIVGVSALPPLSASTADRLIRVESAMAEVKTLVESHIEQHGG
jgi:hypothetical protein